MTGVVTDAGGEPVAGVMVQVASLEDPPLPVPELAVMTDAAGRYEWSLPPGRYRVVVGQTETEATVTAGATAEADLRLD